MICGWNVRTASSRSATDFPSNASTSITSAPSSARRVLAMESSPSGRVFWGKTVMWCRAGGR